MSDEITIYIDAPKAAALLGLSTNTLAKWRLTGAGPRYIKLGRRVVYRQSDIEAWVAGQEFRSTSEYETKSTGRAT